MVTTRNRLKQNALLAAFLLASSFSADACRKEESQEDSEAAQRASNAAAIALWKAYGRDIENALHGAQHGRSLETASSFFREVSGIEIRYDGSYIGAYPTPDTAEDWRRAQDWFTQNHDRLYLDELSKKVKVLGRK